MKSIKNQILIGREEESEILKECLRSKSSELIAVYGRRRVGKTYLIRNVYQQELCFEMTGIYDAPLDIQLANFSQALAVAGKTKKQPAAPATWLEAFQQLKKHIIQLRTAKKKVLFFDELPWLDTRRSGLPMNTRCFT